MHISSVFQAFWGVFLAYMLLLLYRLVTSPLRNIPGPFATRFTRLWYFKAVNDGHFEKENINLHKKYGPIVRLAPKHYSIDDPAAVKQIYGIGTQFRKSDWYYGWQHPEQDTVFALRDNKLHNQQRRKFNSLYSTTNLLNYEPFVDRCADIFNQRLIEFSQSGQRIDMGHWLQCYAFDVIACITYGERFGFLDKGEDVDNAIAHLWNTMRYSTLVGIFSEWHKPLWPISSRIPGTGGAGRRFVMDFVQSQLEKRRTSRKRRHMEPINASEGKDSEALPEDFMEKLLNAQEANPAKIKMADVLAMGQSNIIAGSDTTAISLSGILYNLVKHPQVMQRLRTEIKEKEIVGECSKIKVTYKDSLGMPYLQAVIKEALRLHPATGLPLWRVVPAGGVTVSGQFFPAGTVLGINSWTAHYNTSVFGPDTNTFRPERWLDVSPEHLKQMESYYMPFGLGSRTCMGRHISELEMYKLVPRMVKHFDFELEDDIGLKTENYWFVKPVSFNVRVRQRSES